jgi:hypothetical protein
MKGFFLSKKQFFNPLFIQNTLVILINPFIASKTKKTVPKPKIKNLLKLRCVFLGILKVKKTSKLSSSH